MPFGITGLGAFAAQAPEEFPRFIQFQQDGVDLGDNAVEVVNFSDNLTATRGTGESVNTLTVVGVPPDPPDPVELTWRTITGDDAIVSTDYNNGIISDANTGQVTLSLPSGIAVGKSVLVLQRGAAPVELVPPSGYSLLVRSVLLPITAGQYAILTVTGVDANSAVVSGDLESA